MSITQVTAKVQAGQSSAMVEASIVQADPASYTARASMSPNTIRLPSGRMWGTACLLMYRKDVQRLLDVAQPWRIILDTGATGGPVSLPDWYVYRVDQASPDADSQLVEGDADENSIDVVQLVDVRWLLERWTYIDAQFNSMRPIATVRRNNTVGSGDGGTMPEIYFESQDGGGDFSTADGDNDNPYTWERVLERIWAQWPSSLTGAFDDDLPDNAPNIEADDENYDPLPQNLRYVGVSAWSALFDVLGKLDWTVAYLPTASKKWKIVKIGDVQPGLETLEIAAKQLRAYDSRSLLPEQLLIPQYIRVYFPVVAEHFGCEQDEQLRYAVQANPAYSVLVATGATNAIANTVGVLWSEAEARRSAASSFAILNATNLADIASELVERHIASLDMTRRHRVYNGIRPFLPGSQVSCVEWRDTADGGGWVTSVTIGRPHFSEAEAAKWATSTASARPVAVERNASMSLSVPRETRLVYISDQTPAVEGSSIGNFWPVWDGYVLDLVTHSTRGITGGPGGGDCYVAVGELKAGLTLPRGVYLARQYGYWQNDEDEEPTRKPLFFVSLSAQDDGVHKALSSVHDTTKIDDYDGSVRQWLHVDPGGAIGLSVPP